MNANLELEKKILKLIKSFNSGDYNFVIKNASNLFKTNRNIIVLPNLIGASYAAIGNHEEAINNYKRGLKIEYKNKELLNNLGKSQIAIKLFDEALNVFNETKQIDPNNFDVFFNLGIIYYEKGNYKESLKNYLISIKLNDKFDKSYYNTAILLSKIGKNKESEKYFLNALELNPTNVKVLNNLANYYINENKYHLAFDCLKRAIKIEPNYSRAYSNLGVLFLQSKDYNSSLINFTKAFELNNNLIVAGIQKHFLKRYLCDWSDINELKTILHKTINSEDQISPWYCLSFEDNPENHFIRAKRYSKKFNLLKQNKNIYSNKKIRIAYYAADFHEHAGMINMSGIFQNHNKNEFEIYAFYYGDIKKDKTHYRIKKFFDKFFYVNDLDDTEIYNLSINNKVDIAIFRAGLTINARNTIFSHKVAPIQISFLGYPGTTGQDGIDYIIADKFVIPEQHQNFYSEKIIYLTNCYYPRDNLRNIGSKKYIRDDYKIPKNSFVFCSFNNSYKITEEEFKIWMTILDKVKNSTLLLLASNKEIKSNLTLEIKKNNVDISRVVFLDKIKFEDHLARHSLADLFLDSFNVNAHTSAVDALWTGLPILTRVGNSFASRICGSLLKYFDLEDLITNTSQEYLNKAVELGTNSDKYKKIKEKITNSKNVERFFNTKNYTLNLEKAYKKVHQMRINNNMFSNVNIKD